MSNVISSIIRVAAEMPSDEFAVLCMDCGADITADGMYPDDRHVVCTECGGCDGRGTDAIREDFDITTTQENA